jgi:hypothetical protein
MSTAGKVLVVLIALASLVWTILTAGVTQLNRNANQALVVLAERAAKLAEDVQLTKEEAAQVRDQTVVLQEKMDRDLAVISARQNDAQRMSSSIREILSRVQYELASVQQTSQAADKDRTERANEKATEEKDLTKAREEVIALKATDQELTLRLTSLRDKFSELYKHNKTNVASFGR